MQTFRLRLVIEDQAGFILFEPVFFACPLPFLFVVVATGAVMRLIDFDMVPMIEVMTTPTVTEFEIFVSS